MNLFLDKEKYEKYILEKEEIIKKRELAQTKVAFGGKEAYKDKVYNMNNFEQ